MRPESTILSRIIAGLGHIEGYGDHPGWPLFFALVVIGCAVSWWVGIADFVVFGAILCLGAYDRATEAADADP